MANEAIIRSWFRKSRDDLFAATVLLDANSDRTITQTTYLAQQSIEKALKGLTVFLRKRPEHTHKLETLANTIKTIDPNIDVLNKYYSELKPIELYALYHRYPDASGSEGIELPTREQAIKIVKITKEIFEALSKIVLPDNFPLKE